VFWTAACGRPIDRGSDKLSEAPVFDLKWIKEHADAFDAGLKRRGLAPLAGGLIALDDKRRACLTALQDAQSRRNAASREIGKAKAAKADATATNHISEAAELKTPRRCRVL